MASYSERVALISNKLGVAELNVTLKSKETNNVKVQRSVNHVICIDVSGSMYDVLGHIRTQLKSRLIDIVGDNDTVTIIWFNHKCGYVCKTIEIKKVKDLRELNESIDKLLVPSGCTNFYDPIVLVNDLISKSNKDGLWDFFFMSDGGHNTGGSWDDVLNQLKILGIKIDNSVICEYGYWADTDRLTQMSEVLGGQKIFDKDFESYKFDFEKSISFGTTIEPRVEYSIPDEVKKSMRLQIMWTVDDEGKIMAYSTDRSNVIWVPENTTKFYYLKKLDGSEKELDSRVRPISSAIYLLAERNKYDLVEELLYSLGNKELIEIYCNAYGKQKLESFRSTILDVVKNSHIISEDLPKKWKPNPKKYCVFDFLQDLMNSNALIHLTHPDFKYNFTSAKSVQKIELTEEEKLKMSKANTKLKADKVLDEAKKRMVNMSYSNPSAGYSANQLVWNNERANVSIMVTIPVDLDVPEEKDPNKRLCVSSSIIRNYTIVKDGILNTPDLIVTVNNNLAGKFKRMRLATKVYSFDKNSTMMRIDISKIPIVNRKYVTSVKSSELAKLESELLYTRCASKYLAYIKKGKLSNISSVSSATSTKKGSEIDEYLKSLGITDKGYTPKTELNKSGDFYTALYLETKIEKFSNLPKIEDVLKKRRNKKPFTVSEDYMDIVMCDIDEVLGLKGESLDEVILEYKNKQKDLLYQIALMKFSIIISRRWFSDKDGFDDNKVTYNDLTMSFVFNEKKVDL